LVKKNLILFILYVKFRGVHTFVKGKVKAIPLQLLTGPEGSSRLRLPDFMTIGT
jgi:hypothetical protein